MTKKEIIDGLQFTIEMFLLDPVTGESYKEPRNDMDKTTIDACREAIKMLETEIGWIPVSEGLPEENDAYLVSLEGIGELEGTQNEVAIATFIDKGWIYSDVDDPQDKKVVAWQPTPKAYKAERSR